MSYKKVIGCFVTGRKAATHSKLTLNEFDFQRILTTSSEDDNECFRDNIGVEERRGTGLKGSTLLQTSNTCLSQQKSNK